MMMMIMMMIQYYVNLNLFVKSSLFIICGVVFGYCLYLMGINFYIFYVYVQNYFFLIFIEFIVFLYILMGIICYFFSFFEIFYQRFESFVVFLMFKFLWDKVLFSFNDFMIEGFGDFVGIFSFGVIDCDVVDVFFGVNEVEVVYKLFVFGDFVDVVDGVVEVVGGGGKLDK